MLKLGADWVKASASDQGANCLQARWTKATASGHTGCVEVTLSPGLSFAGREKLTHTPETDEILVRDSKDPHGPILYGPVLRFTRGEWEAFLDGVRKGEFDLPRVDQSAP